MHTKEVGENVFLIDLETGGFKNLIASYVLKGAKTIIVEVLRLQFLMCFQG
jgi:hypothetical protein